MKAIILNESGRVENLKMVELEKPVPTDSEVLIKVKAISINPVDVNARAYDGVLNWIFETNRPVILGWDISGEIVEIGKNVTSFKIGDEVFGMVNFFGNGKAYAQYVASPENHIALKPKQVTNSEAAAVSMVGSTAYQALIDIANIKKGDRVLIHGASGGVGHIALQIAKSFGAYVIATSSAKNREFVLSLGADVHIDYTKEDFSSKVRDVDIVLDTIQGETLVKSIDIVKPNGIIVTLPSPDISQDVKEKASKNNVRIEFFMVSSKKETIEELSRLMEKNVLKPNIHQEFKFEEIAKAHLEVETNHVVGKVVVKIE